jgi:pyruvate/2-oxoglutarate dehydrogenase complex dihydrolipoamide acyltransferase (E2) component
MVEVLLEGLPARVEEATVLNWLFEEGDTVKEGDELVEVQSSEGNLTIAANASGVLAEVYYDEGEIVARGEVLCTIDDEEAEMDDPGRDEE